MLRRDLLAATLLAGVLPLPLRAAQTRASANFLSAVADAEGRYWLAAFGLGPDSLRLHYRLPLPDRGHHVAVHAPRALFVAVARRPGTWLLLGDLYSGRILQELRLPEDRHVCGHGVFSADGSHFYTTESNRDDRRGDSGLVVEWEVGNVSGGVELLRGREFASGGVGPHELLLMPDGNTLVVANGGLRTDPETGTEVADAATMCSSLVYLDRRDGRQLEQHFLPEGQRLSSIRHLDVNACGQVVMGLQYQGEPWEQVPLVAVHQRGSALRTLETPELVLGRMKQYVGSVRHVAGSDSIVASCPRGNLLAFWSAVDGSWLGSVPARDACGVADSGSGLVFSSGVGKIGRVALPDPALGADLQLPGETLLWDNHLAVVPGEWQA